MPYGNYGNLMRIILYHCTKDVVWIKILPESQPALGIQSMRDRMKIYETLKNIYGYCDTFNSIVEADGKYEKISFKGCKDKSFFIDKSGRLPRHHRSCAQRIDYLKSLLGLYLNLDYLIF